MYNYGIVGNCNITGLVHQSGSLDWMCLPRPDSPPVFGKLLDKNGGSFSVSISDRFNVRYEQKYISNTNVLTTKAYNLDTGKLFFEIFDFCPRFEQFGRSFRPFYFFRTIIPGDEPIPIKITCNPIDGWTKNIVKPERGNSHIRFNIRDEYLRVVSNVSMTYLAEAKEFLLTEPLYFGLSWGSAIEAELKPIIREFLDKTISYWHNWVKQCNFPTLYQEEVIRSALALKLQCFEDTGAILAAPTTSLPEEFGSTRNWDYRHCWLRDSYFVLTAFRNLGQFQEMEGFLKYLINVIGSYEPVFKRLHPVYSLDLSRPTQEKAYDNWSGFLDSQPVREGNLAADHIQNDVYGELLLALVPIYKDEKFLPLRAPSLEKIIETLYRHTIASIDSKDASLWEYRGNIEIHSFTNLMSWAGLTKLNTIKNKLNFLKNEDLYTHINRANQSLSSTAIKNCIMAGPQKLDIDASLLLLPILRFKDELKNKATVLKIAESLKVMDQSEISPFLFRYIAKDDFGIPKSAFVICAFWLVEALHLIGEPQLAKQCMDKALVASNHLGLYSEHYSPQTQTQSGNFPQAYSHVGLINAAFAISPRWEDI